MCPTPHSEGDEEAEKEAFRIMKERSALMDEDELMDYFGSKKRKKD